jgi:hypothetical protein
MSDNTSGGGSGEGIYGAAKEAAGSAAEQVRATAQGTYDAGAKAARYVGETTSEHPFLVGTVVIIAFLGGLLSATLNRDTRRRNWRDRGYEMGDHVRSAAPDVSKAAGDAGKYVSESVRENPVSGLLIAAAVGGILGYLLQNRSS